MTAEPEILDGSFSCYRYTLNVPLGHLTVYHDGGIEWDTLQAIKSEVWGPEARAIEVYPSAGDLVNAANARHLWRLAEGEFCPDLLGRMSETRAKWGDMLENRFMQAWADAL